MTTRDIQRVQHSRDVRSVGDRTTRFRQDRRTDRADALAEDGIPHAAPFATWLQQTKGSHRYGPVRDFRHSQIHRTIRQDAKVLGAGVGATPTGVTTSGPDPAKPATHERGALIRDVADFVPERWRSFWELFT